MSAIRFARIFFALAALVVLARLASTILPLDEYVAIVCGAHPSSPSALVLGVALVVIHLLFVLVAPVLALAAGLIAVCAPAAGVSKHPETPDP